MVAFLWLDGLTRWHATISEGLILTPISSKIFGSVSFNELTSEVLLVTPIFSFNWNKFGLENINNFNQALIKLSWQSRLSLMISFWVRLFLRATSVSATSTKITSYLIQFTSYNNLQLYPHAHCLKVWTWCHLKKPLDLYKVETWKKMKRVWIMFVKHI